MKVKRFSLRMSEKLMTALEARAKETGNADGIAGVIRELLSSGLGDPALAKVNPSGRPWPKKRKSAKERQQDVND
jgi:hypothetical protein